MTDIFSPEKRSLIMSKIRGKNTNPEMKVRKLIFSMGFRYRLHRKDLPGCPDIVFPGRKKVIFVHGCFWHNHDCKEGRIPKSNTNYWQHKLERNKIRDAEHQAELETRGWRVLVIWQCQTMNVENLKTEINFFLSAQKMQI